MKRGTYLKTCVILVFLLSMTLTCSAARTISVDDDGPADFNTIQAAIDDANDGDTIIVADGTYTGDGNRDIDFLGKAITLRSENGAENCIINCQGSEADRHRGFYFHSGEDVNSLVDGFTITNGYGPRNFVGEPLSSAGGAILCIASRPMINNCIINCNSASNGGGICCGTGSSPLIKNCTIVNNDAAGGGIYCVDSNPEITNCVITNNIAPLIPGFPSYFPTDGGGIASEVSSPIIANCIISNNIATSSGGGIYCYTRGDPRYSPTLRNCIITGNSAETAG
ncbi:MAG: right-handed parallel beta-helix repeat-containing protein, partial [Planctomycetota bacterium]